MEGAELPVRR